MSTYKSFDLNEATTPAPWGTRENQCWKDAIDTLCVGTVASGKDATNGHRHYDMYDSASRLAVKCDTSNNVSIYSGTDTAGSSITLYSDSSSRCGIISVNTSNELYIYMYTTGGTITLDSNSGNYKIVGLSTNSSGLTSGMLYTDSAHAIYVVP